MGNLEDMYRQWLNSRAAAGEPQGFAAFCAGVSVGVKKAELDRKLKGIGGSRGDRRKRPSMSQQERGMK